MIAIKRFPINSDFTYAKTFFSVLFIDSDKDNSKSEISDQEKIR